VQDVDEARFHELPFGQRRRHAQDWLVGEKDRAFGHAVDIAGEAERGEIVQGAHGEFASAL
jgi:hypothetical protein